METVSTNTRLLEHQQNKKIQQPVLWFLVFLSIHYSVFKEHSIFARARVLSIRAHDVQQNLTINSLFSGTLEQTYKTFLGHREV
jgi:hypothetical protein